MWAISYGSQRTQTPTNKYLVAGFSQKCRPKVVDTLLANISDKFPDPSLPETCRKNCGLKMVVVASKYHGVVAVVIVVVLAVVPVVGVVVAVVVVVVVEVSVPIVVEVVAGRQ